MYWTKIKRAENHPVTNKAQYKVANCTFRKEFIFYTIAATQPVPVAVLPNHALLHTNKPYRVGNLINPRKALGIPKKGKS